MIVKSNKGICYPSIQTTIFDLQDRIIKFTWVLKPLVQMQFTQLPIMPRESYLTYHGLWNSIHDQKHLICVL